MDKGCPASVNCPLKHAHAHTHTILVASAGVPHGFLQVSHDGEWALLTTGVRGPLQLHLREAGQTCAERITLPVAGARGAAE